MADNVKEYWPEDLKGFSIGNEGYLLIQFCSDPDENESKKIYEIDTAKDVTLNFSTSTVDTSCRRSGRWKENLPIINELTVDAEMLFEYSDTETKVAHRIQQAAQRNEIFKIGVFTVDGNGPWFYACATDMGRPEPLEDIVKLSGKYSLSRFIHWYESQTETGTPEPHPMVTFATQNGESGT